MVVGIWQKYQICFRHKKVFFSKCEMTEQPALEVVFSLKSLLTLWFLL